MSDVIRQVDPVFTVLSELEVLQERAGNSLYSLPPRDSPGYQPAIAVNRAKCQIVQEIEQLIASRITEADLPEIVKKMEEWKAFLNAN